jgi:GR25 family glycosyltransferase involved in LPS biosynthesis
MILNEYFSKSYCINLDRRQDRWEKSIKLFEKFNINAERFSAFDGKTLSLDYPHASELGGSISHMNVIKKAKELNLPNVLIFEDDVEIDDDITNKFSDIISQIPNDWDMIYFGGNHQGGINQVSENIFRVTHTYALQMYAVNNKCYDTIINFLEDRIEKVLNNKVSVKPSVAADFFIALLQPSINCYCIRPHLSWQLQDFSDIQERVVNYDYLLKK